MSLTFDADTHTYRWNGRVTPSVTQILKPLTDFSSVPPDVLAAASAFGTAVHKCCELNDLGTLDESCLDPALVPYLKAWRNFSADHAVKWSHIEKPLHSGMGFCGTADRFGIVDGQLSVVDIKSTAAIYPAVGLQLAAYQRLGLDNGIVSVNRYAVRLQGNGSYELQPFIRPTDLSVFASLLSLRNWCVKHNVTPNFSQE